ncbi:DUF429 domain-containing protein [Caballeronia sp. LZ001]|uniref:DUF429 domain-containing protein n=1 Tax=Caballeronia sp. LZ001 TaxID=3038553 RepID=UPI00285F8CCD|nr:DUF429 domain-containing protein [Caballeronia sp. LZ001]MDR5805498.1 DUF429 domain-containing protein [Caballeronia sp. LZ001]
MSVVDQKFVAGIDVGGTKKGFHLVIVRGRGIECVLTSTHPLELHEQCLRFGVAVVAIDAPCRWGAEGVGRTAERQLARERISCFSTPTLERAESNPSGFFDWMINGARVYDAFANTHPILETNRYSGKAVAIETFPHATTCALLGREVASAKLKRVQRRRLLEDLGFETTRLKSIDFVDAALCAVTAQRFVEGNTRAFGDEAGGFIVVPDKTL